MFVKYAVGRMMFCFSVHVSTETMVVVGDIFRSRLLCCACPSVVLSLSDCEQRRSLICCTSDSPMRTHEKGIAGLQSFSRHSKLPIRLPFPSFWNAARKTREHSLVRFDRGSKRKYDYIHVGFQVTKIACCSAAQRIDIGC